MLASVLFSVVLSAVPSARATTWIPLVRVDATFDDTWKSSLEAAAELQLNSKKRTKMVQPPETSIDNTMVAMGCAEWGPKCAHQIGEVMGAKNKMMVDVSAKGDGAEISFRLVDRRGRVKQSAGPYALPDRGKEGRSRALKAVRAFIYKKYPTELVIETTPAGATVRINKRKQRGRSPMKLVSKVDADKSITVVLSKKGYEKKTLTITPQAGVATPVKVDLLKIGEKPPVVVATKEVPKEDKAPDATKTTDDAIKSAETKTSEKGTGAPDATKAPDEGTDANQVAIATPPPADDLDPTEGVTPAETESPQDLGPVLMLSGATTMGVAGVAAIGAAIPWGISVAYAFTNGSCTPDLESSPGTINVYCPEDVLASGFTDFGNNAHFFPWVGLPVAAAIGAAGIGLLASSFFIGPTEFEEGSPAPSAASTAGILPLPSPPMVARESVTSPLATGAIRAVSR